MTIPCLSFPPLLGVPPPPAPLTCSFTEVKLCEGNVASSGVSRRRASRQLSNNADTGTAVPGTAIAAADVVSETEGEGDATDTVGTTAIASEGTGNLRGSRRRRNLD